LFNCCILVSALGTQLLLLLLLLLLLPRPRACGLLPLASHLTEIAGIWLSLLRTLTAALLAGTSGKPTSGLASVAASRPQVREHVVAHYQSY
jgi:hypothetical protein